MSTITLCGSTRFEEEFHRQNARLTLEGHVVFSCGVWRNSCPDLTGAQERLLDEVHRKKIMLSDEIFVINPGGYIGESTAGEIAFAERNHKWIRFLEDPSPEAWLRMEIARERGW